MFDPTNHEELEKATITDWVAIDHMFVDRYTRPVSEARVNLMLKKGFSEDKAGVVMLSLRDDGRYAILDGNHRVQTARKVGVTHMLSRVFIDKTYVEEADLFVAFNTVNRPSALDRFRARLEMGEQQALDIEGILRSHGLHMALNGRAVGGVKAASSLDHAYQDLGVAGVQDIVDILYSTWGKERRAWVSPMIDGMRQFWVRYRTEVKKSRLIDRLQLVTPERVLAEAGLVVVHNEHSSTLVGKTLLHKYNSGLREDSRLSDWITNMGHYSKGGRKRKA